MPGQKGLLSLLVFVLVASTAVYLPRSLSAPAAAAAQAPGVAGGPSTERASTAEEIQLTGTYRDAITLIAQHFGATTQVDQMWRLDAHSQTAVDRFRSDYPQARDSDYPHVQERLRALNVPPSSVEFVIATVPDPIDSNARWQFDPVYDSIQQAVSASGYVLDRFYIPDLEASKTPDSDPRALGRLHERIPGVVLFRKQEGTRPQFLVLFLVFETATGGIHPVALKRAMWTIAEWCAAKATVQCERVTAPQLDPKVIRIIGPNFSGSIPSMGRAINAVTAQFGGQLQYRLITGAATSGSNEQLLRDIATASTPPRTDPAGAAPARSNAVVSYRTTVLNDQELLAVLGGFLSNRVERGRLAVLVEGNTAYGDALRDLLLKNGGDGDLCSRGCEVLPFPLHISRLRNEVDRSSAATVVVEPQSRGGVSLSLDEPSAATDQMPSMAPRLTSSSIDVALAQILGTIEREDIAVIGLFATDSRDKLFLAQQIALRSPDALLFTIEGDLLFTHPDFLPYTRGMIVASSYPLFTGTQLWKPTATGNSARHQFVSTNAQGVYNAAVAILEYDASGKPLRSGGSTPLLDYRSSGNDPGVRSGPFAWVSAVGRNGLWPLHRDSIACPAGKPCPAYTQAIFSVNQSDDLPIHPSLSILLIFIGLQGYTLAYTYRRFLRRRRCSNPALERRVFHGMCYGALLVAQFAALVLIRGHNGVLEDYRTSSPEAATALMFGRFAELVAMAISGLLAAAAMWELTGLTSWRNKSQARRVASVAGLFAAVGVVILAVPAIGIGRLGPEPLLLLNRGLQLFSGVSPFAPVMVLLVAMFAWPAAQLTRVATPTLAALPRAEGARLQNLDALAVGGFLRLAKNAANAIERSLLSQWYWSAILAGVLIIAYWLLAVVGEVQTIESVAFDRFFLGAWLALQTLVLLAIAEHGRLWGETRALLKGLSVHPMINAFERVPKDLFANRLPRSRPGLLHLQHAVNADIRIAGIHAASARAAASGSAPARSLGAAALHDDQIRISADLEADISGDREATQTLQRTLDKELRLQDPIDIADSDTWKLIIARATHIVPVLEGYWVEHNIDSGPNEEGDATPVVGSARTSKWFRDAEVFLAIPIALLVRELTARVVRGIYVLFGALVALVLFQMSFRGYPRGIMLGVTWVYVLLGMGAVVATVVSTERDAVLSRLAGTPPGRIQWDVAFITRTVLPLLFAVFTLFAMQFPDAGGMLLGWLKAGQKAVP